MKNLEIKKKIGARIKQLRLELEVTQEEFAKMIGVSGKTIIANYESGYSTPNDAVRDTICIVCNCSMDYLTCKTDIKTPNFSHEIGAGNMDEEHQAKETEKHNARLQKEKYDGEDERLIAFRQGYDELDDADKDILLATLDALVKARKGDK